MQCVSISDNGALTAIDSAVCDYVLLTQTELNSLQSNNLVSALNELFAFDTATFALINSSALVAFITAHCIGRIVRVMGKT
ncbi:hypothetical protein [Pseudoalteromonas sp. MMG012]|uniref:hypothetical protein n=1 Tax=Pseudoalteromonas sp. MMG012 TaxID=2822686 RepID=UPI001B3A1B4C|nr:hypothetical protein [Pseudoalteromonas sp. MMG012]MBQ4852838.1 hypothetical protein [Pseudoalteromonas sp. MMG012]